MLKKSFLSQIISSTITLFCLTILLVSCGTSRQGIRVETEAAESEEKPLLQYSNLILQKYSDSLIIPVGFDTGNRSRKFSPSSYYDKPFLVTNLIFYNKINDTNHLLLDKTAIINQFDYLLSSNSPNKLQSFNGDNPNPQISDSEEVPEYFFYKIIEQDTNQDGELNYNDAILGYLSDLSGKNLQKITPEGTQLKNWKFLTEKQLIFMTIQQDSHSDKNTTFERHDEILGYLYNLKTKNIQSITPENTQLLEWKFDQPNDLLFLKIRKESDGDGKFTKQDEVNFLKLKINDPTQSQEMIHEELKEKLDNLY